MASKVQRVRSRSDLEPMGSWLPVALRRFGVSGYGRTTVTPLTLESLGNRIGSPDQLYAGMLAGDRAGLILVEHSRWEEGVINKPFGRVIFLGAEDHDGAVALLSEAVKEMSERGVVLASASAGTSPTYIQVAYGTAGFYVGSQAMTLCADLDEVWGKLAKVPDSDDVRFATPDDADTLSKVAETAFTEARFTSDPHFPREWGNRLYADWARQIARGDEHRLVMLEQGGSVMGFANVQRDVSRPPKIPGLFVVTRAAQGAGIGPLLLKRVIAEYRANGSQYPLIGTEKSNSAVNALFFRLGYWIEDVNAIYHWTPPSQRRRTS